MHKRAFNERDSCSRLSTDTTRCRLFEALLHGALEPAAGKREPAE
jgi:hypothetical protein